MLRRSLTSPVDDPPTVKYLLHTALLKVHFRGSCRRFVKKNQGNGSYACSKTENTQRTGLVYIADIERSTSGRVRNDVPEISTR